MPLFFSSIAVALLFLFPGSFALPHQAVNDLRPRQTASAPAGASSSTADQLIEDIERLNQTLTDLPEDAYNFLNEVGDKVEALESLFASLLGISTSASSSTPATPSPSASATRSVFNSSSPVLTPAIPTEPFLTILPILESLVPTLSPTLGNSTISPLNTSLPIASSVNSTSTPVTSFLASSTPSIQTPNITSTPLVSLPTALNLTTPSLLPSLLTPTPSLANVTTPVVSLPAASNVTTPSLAPVIPSPSLENFTTPVVSLPAPSNVTTPSLAPSPSLANITTPLASLPAASNITAPSLPPIIPSPSLANVTTPLVLPTPSNISTPVVSLSISSPTLGPPSTGSPLSQSSFSSAPYSNTTRLVIPPYQAPTFSYNPLTPDSTSVGTVSYSSTFTPPVPSLAPFPSSSISQLPLIPVPSSSDEPFSDYPLPSLSLPSPSVNGSILHIPTRMPIPQSALSALNASLATRTANVSYATPIISTSLLSSLVTSVLGGSVTTVYLSPSSTPLAPARNATFDPLARNNIALYYNPRNKSSPLDLERFCRNNSNFDVINLPIISGFNGSLPTMVDFPGCGPLDEATGLRDCTELGSSISSCQSRGKKVLITLTSGRFNQNGSTTATPTDIAPSVSSPSVTALAYNLWSMFSGQRLNGSTLAAQPLGSSTAVDGFGIEDDLALAYPFYYTLSVELRRLFSSPAISTRIFRGATPSLLSVAQPCVPLTAQASASLPLFDLVYLRTQGTDCASSADELRDATEAWTSALQTIDLELQLQQGVVRANNTKIYLGDLLLSGGAVADAGEGVALYRVAGGIGPGSVISAAAAAARNKPQRAQSAASFVDKIDALWNETPRVADLGGAAVWVDGAETTAVSDFLASLKGAMDAP
ncbi:uncharacterized protein IWZ02DRAFT_433140 [Phyllosticta citriasiana]